MPTKRMRIINAAGEELLLAQAHRRLRQQLAQHRPHAFEGAQLRAEDVRMADRSALGLALRAGRSRATAARNARPRCCGRDAGGRARMRCSIVSIPAFRSRASIDGPMPHRSRSSSALQLMRQSACSITVSPSGLFMSDAVLTRNLFGAMPIEQVRLLPNPAASSALDVAGDGFGVFALRSRPISQHGTSSTDAGLPCGMQVWIASRNSVHPPGSAPAARSAARCPGSVQRFGHAGAGLDAVGFLASLLAAMQRVVVARHRDHRHRPPAQVRRVVFSTEAKKESEINEQAAQRHRRTVRYGNAVSRPARLRGRRNFTIPLIRPGASRGVETRGFWERLSGAIAFE